MDSFGTFEATRWILTEICRLYDNPRVLDVGCGSGDLLISLASEIRHGVGIDISRRAVEAAGCRALGFDQLKFQVLAATQLPDRNLGQFEIILFIGSLEHMADPELALQATMARAHPESRVVVVVISPKAPHAIVSLFGLRFSRRPVVAHLGVDGLRLVAKRAGFQIEDVHALYRGSRKSWPARVVGKLLSMYDNVGGPTCAVMLKL